LWNYLGTWSILYKYTSQDMSNYLLKLILKLHNDSIFLHLLYSTVHKPNQDYYKNNFIYFLKLPITLNYIKMYYNIYNIINILQNTSNLKFNLVKNLDSWGFKCIIENQNFKLGTLKVRHWNKLQMHQRV